MWSGLKGSLGHYRKVRDRCRTRISDLCSRSRAGSCRRVASGAEALPVVGLDGGAEAPPFQDSDSLAGFWAVRQKANPSLRPAPVPRLRDGKEKARDFVRDDML